MSDDYEPQCEVCGEEVYTGLEGYFVRDATKDDPYARYWHGVCFPRPQKLADDDAKAQ